MMHELAIRITADNDEALTEFAKQYKGIWCKEEPDLEKNCNRTHYHGYIQTELTNNGLRKQIYNIFETPKENRGNRTVAFSKVTDVDGYIRYVSKGTPKTYPNIVYNDTEYDPQQYYDEYWKTNQEIQDKIKAERNLKKTAKQNFKDYFINEILPKYPNSYSKAKLTQYQICFLMYTWYKENDKELPSKSQGQIIVNDLFLRYTCPQEKVEDQVLLIYGFKEWHEM